MKTWRFPLFSFYDLGGMERYLEKMAARGRMLERLGNYGWRFVPCKPQKIHFTVTYYPKASAFDPGLTEGQQTLEEFCSHSGWRLVDSNAKLMVFAGERENPTPIHTDPATELELLEQASKPYAAMWIGFLVLLAGLIFSGIKRFRFNPISFLSSTLSMAGAVILPLLGLVILLDLLTWFRWRKKARLAAEQQEPLPPVRGRAWMMGPLLALFAAGTAWGLLAESRPGIRLALLLNLLLLVLLCLAVNGARLLMKKKKASRAANRTVTMIVDVVLAMLLTAAVGWFIGSRTMGDWDAAADELILTAEELSGLPQPGATRRSSRTASFLVTHTQGWDMGDGNVPREDRRSLSYEMVDTGSSLAYPICLRQLLHRYDHYGDYEADWSGDAPFYVYVAADPAPWGAESAWRLQAYGKLTDTYLICWEERLLELDTGWTLSPAQLELAARRFAPRK